MAAQIPCDLCQQEYASIMQTDMVSGNVIAIGDSCAFGFYMTTAQTLAESMPAEVLEQHAMVFSDVIDKLVSSMSASSTSVQAAAASPVTGQATDDAEIPPPDPYDKNRPSIIEARATRTRRTAKDA